MQYVVLIVILLFVSVFGCQSSHHAQWLTPPRENKSQMLGQTPSASVGTLNPFAPVQQSPSDSHVAAEEAEKQRIQMLATSVPENAPDYLKPLNSWYGPFENRARRKILEQDIVRQVGYDPVSEKVYSNEPVYDWETDEPPKGFDWSVLDPTRSVSKIRDWMGLGPDEKKANESMKKGRETLLSNPDLKDQTKCLEAAKHFVEASKKFPDSVLEEDALHLAGECYFFADDYYNAFLTYQKLLVKYQHSKYVDNGVRRLFGIAQYWERESEKDGSMFRRMSNKSLPQYDTFGFAKKAYETIFIHDPNGPVSDSALMALATAYLKRGRYQGDDNYNQAAYYYQQLREDHPLSKYIAKAYENELFARTHAYLGPEHPSKTLDEANKLAAVTLQQFHHELDHEERAGVLELQEDILVKKAERLWKTGQYYDTKKQHYGAARVSYEALIRDYPQTEFAERARRRLEQIEGLRDVPLLLGLPINPFKTTE
jgi:outer membrane protein assembly factor BamD (BamD/ComL family)